VSTLQPLAIALLGSLALSGGFSTAQVDAVPATPYPAGVHVGAADFEVLAWTCSAWTTWQTIDTFCTDSGCPNGCPIRAHHQVRTQTCTDTAGTVFVNTQQREVGIGCCGGTGPCLTPTVQDESAHQNTEEKE